MKMPTAPAPTGYWSKFQALTDSWTRRVVFYLGLMVVFFAVDQLVVNARDPSQFQFPLNVLFIAGGWIPGLANALVIAVTRRGAAFAGYLISAAVLTYILSIAYYYMAGLEIKFPHDHTHGAGIVFVWMIYWFWGGAFGLLFRLMMRKG